MQKFLTPFLSAAFGSVLTIGTVNYVTLQASSPGTADTGNINVSGNVLAGKVGIGTTAPAAMVEARSSDLGTTGVYARTNGSAIRGQSVANSGAYAGGTFESNSQGGWAVYAIQKAANGGIAGHFETTGTNTTGLQVYTNASNTVGVESRCYVGSSIAYIGSAYGSTGYGGSFLGGQYGLEAIGGSYGVYATGNNTGAYGVYARSTSGYAVYASGNTGASGSKSLVIDNPVDPTHSDLVQYCAEGDKPYLIYRGTITLDSSGSAWISLPEYFTSINKDAAATLTPFGASMPNLYQATDVTDGRFKIAGGKPNGRVNWEVAGTRNDNWVRKNGFPNIVNKQPSEVGKYRNPEFFGQPASKGIGYSPRQAAFAETQKSGEPK